MSRRSKLRAWVVALVAALAVVVGSIGVAFAAVGDVPPHTKNLRNNQDGTYTLSLDVVGDSEKKPNNVNVIVIFDTSGSMTQQRMTAAKNAVNSLANSLYAYNTSSEPDTVEMALVRFATSSRVAQQPTANANTFRSTVNGLGNAGDGGTNWESALQTANGVNFNDNDQTFVVFVSDGNPTFRTSQNGWNDWSNQYQQWGSGRETATNIQRCYTTAVDDAKALATKVTPANFFTIGAFGNVDRMEQLTDDAGSNSDTNYYNASDTAALNQAISEILAKIEMSGIGNTSIEDGTTNSVTTSSGEIANLLEVDTSSFKYSRSGGSYGTGQDWADAPEAKLVNGAVEWDLSKEGTNGILENGVKYTVTFDVYPSQTTYDTIAKLKNGDITYDSLDSEIKKYIVDNGGGSYSLRTNTNATLSYDDTRDEEGQQESPYVNPDPVATDAEMLTVKKEWVGANPPSGDLKMTVNMDGEAFSTVTLNSGNSWSDDSYISIGIIKNGEALPGAEGHDFSFAELDGSQYRWELDAPTVHPMLVNGKLTMLVKEDADHKAPAGATKYTIGQGTYYVDNAVTNLTATNTRRSNLNLKKVVTGDNAPADALFPFTLKVKNSKADPSDSTNGDNVVWFSIQDKDGNIVKDASRVSGATAEDGDTGYYYADSNAAISVKLKAGENLRFINLPSGSTYEFTEGDASGFEFVTAENTGEKDSTFTGGKTSTGTVEKAGNLSYEVTYTNKYTPEPVKASFPVKKVIEKAGGLTGPSEWSYTINVTANGNAPEAETMTGTVNQSNDTATFGDFTFTAPGTYTYTVKETGTVAGVTNDADAAGKTVTVKVEDKNGDGKLTATVTPTDGITFTNTYDAKGEAVLEVTKAVEGAGWPAGKKLTFTLDGEGGTLPENKTAELSAPGKATFGAIKYTAADAGKTYTYTISEDGFGDGWTGSGDVTATVKVTDNGNGTLKADVTYSPEDATITNTYNAAGTADIEVTKRLTGRDWLDGETFTFTLTGPNGVNESVEVSEDSPVAKFPTISYTQADIDKTYTYTVSETGNLPGGITKSGDVTVTVKVTDNGNGTLKTDVSYQDGNDTITNKYDATGSVELEAIKELEGRDWKEGESYTFTLKDADGNVLDEKTVSSNTKVTFDALEYTEEDMVDENGNYASEVILNYTIEETTKMPGGMTNSGKINVTVTLTDDGEGNITAKADYTNNDTITNTYEAKGEAVLEVTKAVEGAGWPAGKKLTFTLDGEGGTLPENKTAELSAPGKATFGAIKYTAADAGKTYTYTISEDGFGDGWTGSGDVTATVKVIDNGDGTLSTEVTYDKNDTITNTYKAKGEATLEVEKELVGREWKDGEEYTFTLYDQSGKELGTATATKNGKVAFDTITYDESDAGKTYKYTIKETTDPLPEGVTKSADVEATVEVTDKGDGTLDTKVTYTNNDKVINTYEAKPVKAQIEVEKKVDGFIEGTDVQGNTLDRTFTITMTGPKIDGELSTTITTKGGKGTAKFDEIEYTFEDMVDDEGNQLKEKVFEYEVKETVETPAGWNYDPNTYTVKVTVQDDQNGKLVVTDITKVDESEGSPNVQIVNEYEEEGTEVTLHVVKKIDDQSDSAKDATFKFELKDSEGTTVDEKSVTTKGLEGEIDFNALEFTKAGTYNYTIKETVESQEPGWTYDDHEYAVQIVVADDFSIAKLVVTEKTVDGEEVSDDTINVTFTNVYKAEATKATLKVTKEVDDKSGSADPNKTFTFTLAGDKYMPEQTTKTIKAGETAVFGPITYDKAGTFNYTITESDGGGAAWTYDTTSYPVTVKVVDENAKLVATVTYDGETTDVDGETILKVTNIYDPEDAKATPEARKLIKDLSKSAPDETFTFTLTPQGGAPGETQTVTRENGGPFSFDEITFDKVGTYNYTIQETAGSTNGFTYDTAEHALTITVTDPGDGQLKAEIKYADANEDGELVITNIYEAEPTSLVLDVEKVISGPVDPKTDETFTFELTGDAEMTTSVTGEGTASFDEIKYTEAGTYYYTVTEVPGDSDDYIYDGTVYTVTVEVVDEGGKLMATPTISADGADVDSIVFDNPYVPEVGLKVTKTVTSKPANGSYYKEGETVKYKIVVTNTGECDLADVKVDDELTGDHWVVKKLAAGASKDFTTSYKVTKDDVKAGSVLNVVTAEAENPVDPDKPLKDKDKVEVPTGSEKTPPTPPRKKVIPQTGDDTPTGAMAALTVFGAAALTAGTVLQRRKRK